MPSGTYLASSFLYINLGCHMMFILKNRLNAQGIPSDKSISPKYVAQKIIDDLTSAIFKEHFITTLLIPQQPLTISSFKDLFRKLAHSSIMKLDQASMEKLLYLILMTIKKQFFLTSSPLQMYSLTVGNMKTLQAYAKGTSSEYQMEVNLGHFTKAAKQYSFFQYIELKDFLLTLLQNYQTKVINFSESGHQNDRGKLVFIRRNQHCDLPIGSGKQHSTLKLQLPTPLKINPLSLSSWRTWKTTLALDHATEYEKQSERRKLNSEMGFIGKQNNLDNLFGISQGSQMDFQVQLDLFDYGTFSETKPVSSIKKVEGVVIEKAGGGKAVSAEIKNKIAKQFQGLNVDGQDQLDLLDMMDN